jgi:hypothetical protein
MTGMWLALMVIATAATFGLLWRARQGLGRSAPKPVLVTDNTVLLAAQAVVFAVGAFTGL